jgi:hypothetical protein
MSSYLFIQTFFKSLLQVIRSPFPPEITNGVIILINYGEEALSRLKSMAKLLPFVVLNDLWLFVVTTRSEN